MKRIHRLLPLTCSALLLAIFLIRVVGAGDKPDSKSAESPQLIALRYHADWCGPCKKLAPTFDTLKDRFQEKSILFLTLDFTDAHVRKQSEYLAGALDLGDIWRDNAMITGRILIVDRKSNALVGTYTADQSPNEMADELDRLIDE